MYILQRLYLQSLKSLVQARRVKWFGDTWNQKPGWCINIKPPSAFLPSCLLHWNLGLESLFPTGEGVNLLEWVNHRELRLHIFAPEHQKLCVSEGLSNHYILALVVGEYGNIPSTMEAEVLSSLFPKHLSGSLKVLFLCNLKVSRYLLASAHKLSLSGTLLYSCFSIWFPPYIPSC